MIRLNHVRHSILALGVALAAISATNVAHAGDSPYFGRWTESEDNPKFTAKGRLYKTFDVAPCGADFCGVSVSDNGQCGPTLFRFLMAHSDGTTLLNGHGAWGNVKKALQIETFDNDDATAKNLNVYLANDAGDFDSREGSDLIYNGQYKRTGDAKCMTN